MPRQLRQHAGLGVGRGGGDHVQRHAPRGELAAQPLDILDGRVAGVDHSEEDLELGVVLFGVGADGFVEPRVAAAHRFEDGNGGRRGRLRRGARVAAPSGGGQDGKQVVGRRGQRRGRQPDHRDTSATPQITSAAPAQRSQLTCSFRTYLAIAVSRA